MYLHSNNIGVYSWLALNVPQYGDHFHRYKYNIQRRGLWDLFKMKWFKRDEFFFQRWQIYTSKLHVYVVSLLWFNGFSISVV